MRDAVLDFTAEWAERTEIPAARFISWLELQGGKFYAWKERYGKANEHDGRCPRDHWLTPDEEQAILDFHEKHRRPPRRPPRGQHRRARPQARSGP